MDSSKALTSIKDSGGTLGYKSGEKMWCLLNYLLNELIHFDKQLLSNHRGQEETVISPTPAAERLLGLEAADSVHSLCLFLPIFLYVLWKIFQPISHCTEEMNSLSSYERDSVKVDSIICNLIYIDVGQRPIVNPREDCLARGWGPYIIIEDIQSQNPYLNTKAADGKISVV